LQIKGIFFDLGGTLFSYRVGLGGRAIRHVVSSLAIEAPPEDIGKAWLGAHQSVAYRYGKQSYFLHKDLFVDTLAEFLQQFGHQATTELAEEFHRIQREELVEKLPLREDCTAALGGLKEAGLYLSIVSNIDDDYLSPLVEKHALERYLDHWTSSEEAASCKPDSGIFRYCINKSGLLPEEVLFVGDSLHHDVAGADAVGMRSVRIIEPGVETPLTQGLEVTAQPTFEISSLHELLDIVRRHNDG
jgi:putative hydrolase of the HAD superfamily